jgi:predicted AlkP superfamily pyrophosphatase or phosphodiesterase
VPIPHNSSQPVDQFRKGQEPTRAAKLCLVVAALAVLALLAFTGASAFQTAHRNPRRRHVVVISVDGMRASDYVSPPPGAHIPNILRLKDEGSHAEGMQVIYPSVTYPSHTTIVTGCLPAEHGIYTNQSSRVAGKNPNDWFWFTKAIRRTTLWDEARQRGLTTASVTWPVTAGARIDWDLPEIWNPALPPAPEPLYVARFMNPAFAVELFAAMGTPKPSEDEDVVRTRVAEYVIEKHKPDLTLIHLIDLDQIQHAYGPDTPQAIATLNRIDGFIGEILGAVRQAGLAGDTDVFIVSDHGFLPIHSVIHPNTLLVKAGLLTAAPNGAVTGGKIATVAPGGSFFIYWPKGSKLGLVVDRALEPLLDRRLVWAVLGPQALRDLGADPQARLALDAPTGAMFDMIARGPLVTPGSGGDHGYLPFRRGLAASFIAWGPDIKPGVDLHTIPEIAAGPTILKAMGIVDSHFGDHPPLRGIWRK